MDRCSNNSALIDPTLYSALKNFVNQVVDQTLVDERARLAAAAAASALSALRVSDDAKQFAETAQRDKE